MKNPIRTKQTTARCPNRFFALASANLVAISGANAPELAKTFRLSWLKKLKPSPRIL
ncbi:MAG: hypothetical protein HQK63_13185 [Desulfamplus sp.]|nr:hypothetical protein [Desulfamplus sp.]